MKHRIIIFGTSNFGLPSFTAIADEASFEIVGVITQPPRPQGRHATLTPTAVAEWAEQRSLPLFTFSTLKDSVAQKTITQLEPDLAIVAAYGLILPPAVLNIPKFGCLNIHGSLLPAYRGASPIAAAILSGDKKTGVTFMLMDEGVDTGPLLATEIVYIENTDTKQELENKLSKAASIKIVEVINKFMAEEIKPIPQPVNGVSSTKRLTRADGQAHWQSAELLARQTRAYYPWPGLWFNWQDRVVKIISANYLKAENHNPIGTVFEISSDPGWAIACADGLLVPQIVQFSGHQAQPASSVPGSYPGFIGQVLS